MARKKKSLSEAVSSEIQASFNLDGFKSKKGLTSKAKFKEQTKQLLQYQAFQWGIYVYLEDIQIQEKQRHY